MVAQGRERALKLGQPGWPSLKTLEVGPLPQYAPAAVNQGPGRARMELIADTALCRAGELGKLESPACQCRGQWAWRARGSVGLQPL